MKERPILFSGPMVRAILDGRKTQTRRVMKEQPSCYAVAEWPRCKTFNPSFDLDGSVHCANCGHGMRLTRRGATGISCPYGKPGDRLWVREAWKTAKVNDYFSPKQMIQACRDAGWKSGKTWVPIEYLADGQSKNWETFPHQLGRYRQGRFMPRDYSRITLEITEVRVQRVQEISFEDCLAEGVISTDAWTSEETASRFHSIAGRGLNVDGLADVNQLELQEMMIDCGWQDYARAAFATLWESINGPSSWDANPWVWAITFKPVEQESAAAKRRAL